MLRPEHLGAFALTRVLLVIVVVSQLLDVASGSKVEPTCCTDPIPAAF